MKRTLFSSFFISKYMLLSMVEDCMKKINNELIRLYLVTISITFLLLFGTYLFVSYLMQDKVKTTTLNDNLMVEINPNIKRTIYPLSDFEGLKTNKNIFNITNMGSDTNYKVYLYPIIENDEQIRIDINDLSIKYLSDLQKEDNAYIIKEDALPNGYTAINFLRL